MENKIGNMRLSPTAVLTYLKNPREFYYTYVLRLPTPINRHMIKGTIVHKTLEKFFTSPFNPELEKHIENIFNEFWNEKEEEWNTLQLTPDDLYREKEDCLNQLQLYVRSLRIKIDGLKIYGKAENDQHAFYLLRPKFKELWVEDKDLNLGGYIDRIYKDYDDNTIIGDYKTSNRFGIGTKQDYVIQCGIYAYLYKRVKEITPDYVSVIYLRVGEEVMIKVTPELIKYAIEKVKYVRERIQTDNIEDYPRNEDDKFFSFHDIDSGIMSIKDEARRKKALEDLKERQKIVKMK